MISKPIPAESFYHTCRYICQKPGAEVLITEGVRGHNYKVMAEDFIRQQQLRPSRTKACLHSILSFHPSEKPSDEIMAEIAQKYLERLGIVNTQFAVVKHTDRAHPHLHIVANLVDNKGQAISDSWIGLRGKKVAQALTQEYNLVPAIRKDLALTHTEAMSELEVGKYKIYQVISEHLPHCRTLDDLEKRLASQGIEVQYKYKGHTQERQGISFAICRSRIAIALATFWRRNYSGCTEKILPVNERPLPVRHLAGGLEREGVSKVTSEPRSGW